MAEVSEKYVVILQVERDRSHRERKSARSELLIDDFAVRPSGNRRKVRMIQT